MKATIVLALMLVAITGCTAMQTNTLQSQVDTANKAVTIVLTTTDAAYTAKLITKAQAESVSTIAKQIEPLLDSAAAAAAASDTAGAAKTMTLVNSLLAGLKAYVPPASPPATGAK